MFLGLNSRFIHLKEIKYKEIKAIDGGLLLLFEGKPEKIEVKEITGLVQDYKVSHQKFSDSVRVWFDAQKENLSSTQGTNLKFSYDTKVKKIPFRYSIVPILRKNLRLKIMRDIYFRPITHLRLQLIWS